mmetsp:Transcript_31022/g.79649  ORF Transcript_31022/g.79649 Transcript_31022/m.79649 type:complete len:306 (+) Transcript_31022:178-1095(+)
MVGRSSSAEGNRNLTEYSRGLSRSTPGRPGILRSLCSAFSPLIPPPPLDLMSRRALCCASYPFSCCLCRPSAPLRKLQTSPPCLFTFLAKWSRWRRSVAALATKSAEWVTSSTVVLAAAGDVRYEASQRVAGRSRWLVGSSRSSSPGSRNSAWARAARVRQPPLSVDRGASCIALVNPRPVRMRLALPSAAYASRASSCSPSSPSLCAAVAHCASPQAALALFPPSPPGGATSAASISLHSRASSARSRATVWSEATRASNADSSEDPSSSWATQATSLTAALRRPVAMSRTMVDLPLPLAPSRA